MSRALLRIAYFLIIFGWIGTLIRAEDVATYNLQQLQIFSLAGNGSLALTPGPGELLKPRGDVFEWEGKTYAAKQPGIAFWGTPWVWLLNSFGLDYGSQPLLTALWVTWLAVGTWLAALLTIWQRLLQGRAASASARRLGLATLIPLAWLGLTPVLPYAGLLHHDVFASSLLILAAALLMQRSAGEQDLAREIFGSSLAGLSIFFSGLPTVLVAVAAATRVLLFARHRKWRLVFGVLGGVSLGLVPTFITQALLFGNPFVPGHWVGGYTDTTLRLQASVVLSNLWTYWGGGILSVWLYAPLLVPGLLIAATLPTLRWMLPAAAAHIIAVLLLDTIGHCQWGPRYLLPLHGLSTLALVTWYMKQRFSSLNRLNRRNLIALGLAVLVLISAVLQWIGTRVGTMLCDFRVDPPVAYLQGLLPRQPAVFPLEPWGFLIALLGFVVLFIALWREGRLSAESEAQRYK